MGSTIRELEELRSMLETPRKTYTPYKSLGSSPPRSVDMRASYNATLSTAERSVDRLSKAINQAEDEMEAALRRTTEVHKSQLRQKELELQELQRVIAAKERSIDSLRDTLSTTKRTYESRLSQFESALEVRESEVRSLQDEARMARMEADSLQQQLQKQHALHVRELHEFREKESEFSAALRMKTDESAKTLTAMQHERSDRERLEMENTELMKQVSMLADELRAVKADSRLGKDRMALEISDLKKRLKTEKSIKKACEKWLKTELKSREEMETLLSAIKESAGGRDHTHPSTREVEHLLDNLRRSPSPTRSPVRDYSPALAIANAAAAATATELEHSMRAREDTSKLRAELAAARKLLVDRLLH